MILSFVLKSFNPILQISSPSMRILPLSGSTNLNKALINVVLPLPVLPTTPTLVPSMIVQVIPVRTRGAFGRYRIFHCQGTKKSEYEFSLSCTKPKNLNLFLPYLQIMQLYSSISGPRRRRSHSFNNCRRFWGYAHELLDPFNRYNVV